MPKQKGIIKLKGTLNGVCYYPLKGMYIKRKATGPSRERIYNDPAFKTVKANTQEFGGASKLSKAIRTGILETTKQFQDPTMSSRLTGTCYNIIQEGSGIPGKREANLANNPQALIGFKFNKKLALDNIYTAKPIITSKKNRRIITLNIPESSKKNLKKIPKTATHFQLIAALSVVSGYKCRPNQKAYRPITPKHNALGTTQKTQPLLCKIEHKNLQIKLETPVKTAVSKHASLVVWFGIQFIKQEGIQYYSLKNSKVMQCVTLL